MFRIEHKKRGEGIYAKTIKSPEVLAALRTRYGCNIDKISVSKHPNLFDDPVLFRNVKKACENLEDEYRLQHRIVPTDLIFGFSTPLQLLRWFYVWDDIVNFEKDGFILAKMEGEFIKGSRQACMFRYNIEHVDKYSLVEYLSPYRKTS